MRVLMLHAVSSDKKWLKRVCVYESSVMCNGRNLASKVLCVFRAFARVWHKI
jgi:hypothetical protein